MRAAPLLQLLTALGWLPLLHSQPPSSAPCVSLPPKPPPAPAAELVAACPEAHAADCTAALQAALDSHAYTVRVPALPDGRPWLVQPLCLRSNQTLLLEPGAVVMAKAGSFHGVRDALLNAVHTVNTTVIGYGATLRMRRIDYMNRTNYAFGATRGGINLWAAAEVRLLGLRVEECGGDGLLVMREESANPCAWHEPGYYPACPPWSRDVEVRDCVFDRK